MDRGITLSVKHTGHLNVEYLLVRGEFQFRCNGLSVTLEEVFMDRVQGRVCINLCVRTLPGHNAPHTCRGTIRESHYQAHISYIIDTSIYSDQ